MDSLHEKDLNKIKELLRHAGEFIAYFELAESKMIAWRQDIESQSKAQEIKTAQHLQGLHNELQALQDVLTQAGLARLRISSEEALKQGEAHLMLLNKSGQQLLADIQSQHHEFNKVMVKHLNQIERYTSQALSKIDQQLAKYDVEHFHRVANESCDKVQITANNSIEKSTSLLRNFQWRSISLALLVTFITTFTVGMYICNELPWEIHQRAINEREAGRALLHAWPNLSQQVQEKILNKNPDSKS